MTFSIGYRFHYWPKYENKKKPDFIHIDIRQCDLFIKKKFDDFKSEILAYDNISKEAYNRVMAKAAGKKKTKTVKKIKAIGCWAYRIAKDEAIGLDHVIAVILYCDYTDHCSRFSKSFRSLSATETLEETKKRNRNYYWMARRLRETAQMFGENRARHEVTGPFFCGINQILVIPQFRLHLNSPTSTTLQRCVAEEFAGDNGMILKLNNDCRNRWDYSMVFDASIISHYPQEQERCGDILFFQFNVAYNF